MHWFMIRPCFACRSLGQRLLDEGKHEDALVSLHSYLQSAQAIGDVPGEANAKYMLGLGYEPSDVKQAISYLERCGRCVIEGRLAQCSLFSADFWLLAGMFSRDHVLVRFEYRHVLLRAHCIWCPLGRQRLKDTWPSTVQRQIGASSGKHTRTCYWRTRHVSRYPVRVYFSVFGSDVVYLRSLFSTIYKNRTNWAHGYVGRLSLADSLSSYNRGIHFLEFWVRTFTRESWVSGILVRLSFVIWTSNRTALCSRYDCFLFQMFLVTNVSSAYLGW